MTRNSVPALAGPRPNLAIEYLDPCTLLPYAGNARHHPEPQIKKLMRNIRRFGFAVPAVVNGSGDILAGHARIEAAMRLALSSVPCIRIPHFTAVQERAFRIADNRLAELASWDRDVLAQELQALLELDIHFDVEETGFDTGEIDLIIADNQTTPDRADEMLPTDPQAPVVTRPGDLWLLGKHHRLLCGDAREPASFARLLEGAPAQLVFADPPYNVPIDGHASGLGRIRHRDFAMASGEMSAEEYSAFLATLCTNLIACSSDGAIHFLCSDWRHVHAVLDAASPLYSELKNICVWNKDNGGMGRSTAPSTSSSWS